MLPPRGYVFIGLNAVRFLSVISLLLVFSSNIVTLTNDIKAVNAFVSGRSTDDQSHDLQYIPNSTIPNEPAGAAWGVLNRLLIIFQVVVLFMSEVGWPAIFFDRYFPILGRDFGVGALGLIQCLLGAAILSHHVDKFTLVSAFFLFSVGCLNILVGLIWREKVKSRRSITAWKDRAKDLLPTRAVTGVEKGMEFGRSVFSQHTGTTEEDDESTTRSGSVSSTTKASLGFGRQGEKAAELKGYLLSRPAETLPRYAPKPNGGSRASSPTVMSSAV